MISKNQQYGYSLIEVMIVLTVMTLLTVLVVILTKTNSTLEPDETRWSNEGILSTSLETPETSTETHKSLNKPTFSSSYQVSTSAKKGNAENSDIKIEITPIDLAERKIDGIKVDLSAQGLPTPSEAYAKINAAGEKSVRDWSCQLGPIIICQGPTVLVVKLKSTFDIFFTESLVDAPNNLTVQLLENTATATTLSVPLQNL